MNDIEAMEWRRPHARRSLSGGGVWIALLLLSACTRTSSSTQGATDTGSVEASTLRTAASPESAAQVEQTDGPEQGPAHPGGNVPGQFDYYVLSLSWSPQYCASRGKQARPDDPQCGTGAAFGFVLHGLWPQYATRGFPESCSLGPNPTPDTVTRMLRIMPSQRLIEHEWQKHGTCSGMTPDRYFAAAESLFTTLRIPTRYRSPAQPVTTTVAELRQEITAENPTVSGENLAIYCRGNLLREVRLCFAKDLKPQACSAGVHDGCPPGAITVLPIRTLGAGQQ